MPRSKRLNIKDDLGMQFVKKPKECFKIWVNNVKDGPTFHHLAYALTMSFRMDLNGEIAELLGVEKVEEAKPELVST